MDSTVAAVLFAASAFNSFSRHRLLCRSSVTVTAILLVAVIALLLTGVFSRYILSLPIVWIDEAASISFLWLAM
jgi:TRAP-type C4-dicarboxylate transport system permease small subunit